jgi:hypothetical protein
MKELAMRHVMALILLCGFVVSQGWRLSAITTPATKQVPDKGADPGKKRPPQFTIGKDTTYVTGPVDKDGYIDYTTALNDRLRQGVTVDNNANVLLMKVMGPKFRGKALPPEYFRLLGIQAPPEGGDYFVDRDSYMKTFPKGDFDKQNYEFDEQLDRAQQRPWTAKEYPKVFGWLKENDKQLNLVVEATKRTHYYSPLVIWTKEKKQLAMSRPLHLEIQMHRQLASCLVLRAMLRVSESRFDEAWQDLQACHRLGRLVFHGGTIMDHLAANFIESIAIGGDLVALDRSKLNSKQIMQYLDDLQSLPPKVSLADTLDVGDRLSFLDEIMWLDRGGAEYWLGLAKKKDGGPIQPAGKDAVPSINWDAALRGINDLCDKMAGAMRVKDRSAREKELEKIIKQIKAPNTDAIVPMEQEFAEALLLPGASPEMRGKAIGDLLVRWLGAGLIVPQKAVDRLEQNQRNLHLAFALAGYQRDHGNYPKKLEDLAPKYLATIPQDLFTGKALVYQPSANGYLLYSFGVNGRDDQGRGYDDDPPGDDLSVRMPLPMLKERTRFGG